MTIARSTRDALREAERRGCRCEAVTPRAYFRRSTAADRVPKGGLLVRQDDGMFIAIALIPKETRS